MADLVTNIIGQDNLSQTVNDAKKSIEDFGNAGKEAGDKIDRQFNNIMRAAIPMQQKLKGLKSILAGMEINGQAGSEQFTKIAQAAGEMKDAIADANEAIGRFSSDSMKIDAVGDAFSVAAGGASTLAGVLGMVGVKSDGVQRMILKVQSALALLNGVQAIANKLNKDSALMQRLKQIRLQASTREISKNTTSQVANTTAETADTIAKGANTAATAVNTAATATDTVKQNAWNVAKAIGKALLGDWSGLLLVAAGGLVTYSMFTDDATDSQKELNKSMQDGQTIADKYRENMNNNFGQMMSAYTEMKAQFNALKTDDLRMKWADENRKSIEELCGAWKTLNDLENIFNGNTNSVVEGIKKRAEMQAASAVLTELYSQLWAEEASRDRYKAKAESERSIRIADINYKEGSVIDVETVNRAGLEKGKDFTIVGNNRDYERRLTSRGANLINQYRTTTKSWAEKQAEFWESIAEKNIVVLKELIEKYAGIVGENALETFTFTPKPEKEKKPPKQPKEKKQQREPKEGSIAWYENKASELEKDIKEGYASASQAGKVREWREIAKRMRIAYGLEEAKKGEKEPDAGTYGANEKRINEINKQLRNEHINTEKENKLLEERGKLEEQNRQIAIRYGWAKEEEKQLEALAGSVAWYDKQIKEIRERAQHGYYINDSIEETAKEIDRLEKARDEKAKQLEIGIVLKEGSVAALKKQIDKNNEIIENTTDVELIAKLSIDNDRLQEEINNKTRGKLTVEAYVKPSFTQKGSLDDKRESLQNAQSRLSQIKSDYQNRLISKEEALAEIKEINDKLAEIGVKPIELNFRLMNLDKIKSDVDSAFASFNSIASGITSLVDLKEALKNAKNGWSEFLVIMRTAESVFNSVMEAIKVFNVIQSLLTKSTEESTAASIANTAAKQAEASAEAAESVASATSEGAKKPWPLSLVAIASGVAAVLAALALMKGFANGGIVGGSSYSGDKVLARLNSGEMILNGRQQSNLFRMIDRGFTGEGSGTATVSTVRIKGSDLFIALKNYQSIKNKSKNVNL